jgi:hypothetical protein
MEFLYSKARNSYLEGKSSINASERNDIDRYLMVIDKNLTTLDRLNKDATLVSNDLLDPAKKIVNPLMVAKNEQGNWRMKTKDEIEQELKNAQNDIVTQDKKVWVRTGLHGGQTISETPVNGGVLMTRTLSAYRNPNLIKQLEGLFQSYDQNIESFNKTIPLPSSLSFSKDQFKLKQYGVYELKDLGNVKGEDAEAAINRLLYIAELDFQAGTDKRTQLEKAVDETTFGDVSREGIKLAIKNVLNSVSTSAKDHSVQYFQFTGIPGDERKGYVIRFNDEYLNSRISQMQEELGKKPYQKTISGRDASDAIQALEAIQQNGLKIFTGDEGIAGSLSGEYNIFERALQDDMRYETPAFLKDRYNYNIVKLTDNSYELRGNYKVKDLDENNNVVNKDINLAGEEVSVRFPFKSSFTSIIKTTNDWIQNQLLTADAMYKEKLKKLNSVIGPDGKRSQTISEAELEKYIRLNQIQPGR